MIPESLSAVERLQLVNQFLILQKLDPDSANIYADDLKIVQHGYAAQYSELFAGIQEEMTNEECEYVHDVLEMHRILLQSYEAVADKQGLILDDIKFRGFDGNNETRRLAYAEHLKNQGRWEEVFTGPLNSHSIITMSLYPKMLERFNPINESILESGSGFDNGNLSAEQIRQVISKG
jgi:uncharacterized protein YfbU (UPF0304 family)